MNYDPALLAEADQALAELKTKLHEIIDKWRNGELVHGIIRDEAQHDPMLRVGGLAAWLYFANEPANVACLLAAAIDQLAQKGT